MQQKYQELKENFDEVVTMGLEFCPDVNRMDIVRFLLSITFRIWNCNTYYAREYGEAIRAVQDTPYTMEQITTAMACCGEKERNIKVPAFLLQTKDISNRKKLLNSIGDYLAAAAMINGDFTLDEAGCWNDIMLYLSRKCLGAEANQWTFDFVPQYNTTELKEDSYIKSLNPIEKDSSIKQPDKPETNTYFPNTVLDDDNEEEDSEAGNNTGDLVGSLLNYLNNVNTKQNDTMEHAKVNQPGQQSLNTLLEELDGLVGLQEVKKDVRSLMNFIKVANLRKEKGLKVPAISYHLVFTGNPGTGKTTIARLIAQIYYKMGLLTKGQMIETDRSALVAGYLGQTAIKTQKVIEEALGGVLFIDEAYSLAGDDEDSYGKEAIETLLKAMEDHRDDLVVIVAGYDELMHKFINSNPGLRSRFNKYFHFPDYTGDELVKIFEHFCEINGYAVNKESLDIMEVCFAKVYENREEHFGNARAVRNTFETAICNQANRIAELPDISEEVLIYLTKEDIQLALKEEFGC